MSWRRCQGSGESESGEGETCPLAHRRTSVDNVILREQVLSMKHPLASLIAGWRHALTAVAIMLTVFLCVCGEQGEEPPSAATTPAPTGTVEPTLMAEPTFGSNPLPPFPSPKVPTPDPSPTPTPSSGPTKSLCAAFEEYGQQVTQRAVAKCVEAAKGDPVKLEGCEHLPPFTVPLPWYLPAEEIERLGPCSSEEISRMEGLPPSPMPARTPTLEPLPWEGLRDGQINFFCEERLMGPDGWIDFAAWVEQTIEDGWGIEATYHPEFSGNLYRADLIIYMQAELVYGTERVCGLAPVTPGAGVCNVTLSWYCWDQDFIYEDVPEKTLLHEVGHCMGFGDREDYEGIMHPSGVYWPNEEDRQALKSLYGLE